MRPYDSIAHDDTPRNFKLKKLLPADLKILYVAAMYVKYVCRSLIVDCIACEISLSGNLLFVV
jgi:hypothetical protein